MNRAFRNPWISLDWRDLGTSQGEWLTGESSHFALRDVSWSLGDLHVEAQRGTQFTFPTTFSGMDMARAMKDKGYGPIILTSTGGYDLRTYEGMITFEAPQVFVLPQAIPVLWIGGKHPLKGCLYMSSSGRVSTQETEDVVWTSHHAYPKSPDKIATRVRVKAWLDDEGYVHELKDCGEGVWEWDPSMSPHISYLEAVTF